jgi:hypothetical protein
MKTWTLLVLVLLLGFAPAASAGTPAFQTNLCGDQSLDAIFAANVQATSPNNDLFGLQSAADPPVCQVICATSPCQSNSECTAAPNGHCRFACPGQGCCVYP